MNVKTVVEMENIPPGLILNSDQTGITIIPGFSWTPESKGFKRTEITGLIDKRQITGVFCEHLLAISFRLGKS